MQEVSGGHIPVSPRRRNSQACHLLLSVNANHDAPANTQAKVYQECFAIVKHAEILLITAIIAERQGVEQGHRPAFCHYLFKPTGGALIAIEGTVWIIPSRQ